MASQRRRSRLPIGSERVLHHFYELAAYTTNLTRLILISSLTLHWPSYYYSTVFSHSINQQLNSV
jgi:hypothetical protein